MAVLLEGAGLASSCVSPIRGKMLQNSFASTDIEFDSKQVMTE